MRPNEPYKVTGDTCLDWIDKRIGFAYMGDISQSGNHSSGITVSSLGFQFLINGNQNASTVDGECAVDICLDGWNHDETKRKIGLVLHKYSDGGLKVAILSTDIVHNVRYVSQRIAYMAKQHYVDYDVLAPVDGCKIDPEQPFPSYPDVRNNGIYPDGETFNTFFIRRNNDQSELWSGYATYDETLAYQPELLEHDEYFPGIWTVNGGQDLGGYTQQLTTSKNTTAVFGDGFTWQLPLVYVFPDFIFNDPLHLLSGNLYSFVQSELGTIFHANCPGRFFTWPDLYSYQMKEGEILFDCNSTAIPYNLILTESEQQANAYLTNGVVPSDAWLYPLDWENFPQYVPGDDDGDDGVDDNTTDDNSRDITPNLPVAPTFTPSMLSNYNWYWLTAPQLQAFVNWFWNDVGTITDFSDLVEKIQGLYNDLASAVLMVRYYPVDNDATWIGGKESTTSIKLGMIEQSANVDQLKTTVVPSVREIGDIHIPDKYNSFVDLSPYSALSLYLPFHGFVDMDMNLFSGHDIYVKGVYDHLTGTLQYLIYLDNQFLVNSFVVKMAVDIPITLQSKNDRDSAIFNNLTSSVGGLLGAGATLATGNPIGLVVGAQSMNSGVNSAPLNVRGTVGETGAFYAPPQCAIILRRPTISKPSEDIWKRNIGQICGQSYTLSNLRGKGYTKVYNPRITFTSSPLQSEIDEIYDFLTEGVIL